MRIILVFLLCLFPLSAQAEIDVACESDCLMRGLLPNVCIQKCGGSIKERREDRMKERERIKSRELREKYPEKYDKYGYEEKGYFRYGRSYDREESKQSDAKRDDFDNVDFACFKQCRRDGESMSDCKDICSSTDNGCYRRCEEEGEDRATCRELCQ